MSKTHGNQSQKIKEGKAVVTDGMAIDGNDMDMAEKHVEEWGRRQTPVVMTNDEWCMLTFFLSVSIKYMEREAVAFRAAGEADGSTGKNAEYLEALAASVKKMEKDISVRFLKNSMDKGAGQWDSVSRI